MKNVLNYIPGFRSRRIWKMIIASIYYVICLLVLLACGIGPLLIFVSWTLTFFGAIVLLIKGVTDPRFKKALKEKRIEKITQNGEPKITTQKKVNKHIERKNKLKEYKQDLKDKHIAYCPKCMSTSISAQKKGFGIGKAVVAAELLNPIDGIFIGGIGRNKMYLYCMNCGHKFKARR
jgi:hypothetical protein